MFNQVSLNSVLVILVNQPSSKITLIRHNGSLGPGLRIGGKRKKNRRAKRAERKSGKGKGSFPTPKATAGLASFADMFPIRPLFCLFLPLRSLVPG